ncbi:ABC transporter related protein [Thermaerobacter marianensis DSM 12885]|uniref:ABC transporter related protein n=1 Tax=Thermaerobacter marianensis (strain ATCC 700841 / DSM 12885 / JCM 10246 / 7p75a) TaxID=644966 RepID=E6SM74_THEM7|nr:ABC transporter ATP-binding protein [Thermaerobacter marianensis]ADU51433.1 ABC transporter related protein [Thermaerobacter marianensis DSM 12885]
MDAYREDEHLGKIYDGRLMRRLLGYARPHMGWILVSILLLLAVTAADLAGPLLIRTAIDHHLRAADRPRIALNPADVDRLPAGVQQEAVAFEGRFFVREDRLPADFTIPGGAAARYQVLEAADGRHYLVQVGDEPVTAPPAQLQVDARDGATVLLVPEPGGGPRALPARLLSRAELHQFRLPERAAVARIAGLYLALAATAFVLAYTQGYLLHRTAQRIVAHIRAQVFGHLQRMSLSYFDRNPVGRLVTRVTNDVETLNEMYTSVVVNLFRDLFVLVGIAAIMLAFNPRLALTAFAVLPLVVAAAAVFRTQARAAYRQMRVRLARINAFLSENISGMRIIQIFRREREQFAEFDEINRSYLQATLRHVTIFAVFRPVIDFLSSLALALVVAYGGAQVLGRQLELGVLVAFIQYVQRFFRPITELAEKFNILQSAMASAERIFGVLDTPPAIVDPVRPRLPARVRGAVEFDHVWFAYRDEEWVLQDVSFKVEPGETVAFVGHTGAGKTSILSLMSRFYDVQRGAVRVDGIDVREWPQEELRRHIAVVQQDVFLFTGTIRDNIRLWNPEISDAEVERAARLTRADAFIRRLPRGYDEPVTERGSTLSAGQRQLLAFARALAYDPAILVLDEATANIDTETEQLIQEALRQLTRGRTTLIVAHRLSTIQHADRIIVLHRGRIREMGTHQELLARGGLYHRLWMLQHGEQEGLAAVGQGD